MASDSVRVITYAGSGSSGRVDGPMALAQFNQPCGLAIDHQRSRLYILDCGNHCIRYVDQKNGMSCSCHGITTTSHFSSGCVYV
jgi:hypothetical protein